MNNKVCGAGREKVSAIIVAAGKSSRMGGDKNKLYIDIDGMPVIARTLRVFEECDAVDEVVLVVNTNDMDFCREAIVEKYRLDKVKHIVAGGASRQKSVRNGLSVLGSTTDIVIVHDGARPFVTCEQIRESILASSEYGAAIVAVPVKDTIKVLDSRGFVSYTPGRDKLISVQTPQAFRHDLIIRAHEQAEKDGITGTDDAVLVERLGHKVGIVGGSYDNIKITTPEDLIIAEKILEARGKGNHI